MIINYLLLAFCVSIDSFGIGITYGIKNTKISIVSKLILAVIAIVIANISIFFGQILLNIFPSFIVNIIGSVIFLLMGSWIIYQALHPKEITIKQDISTFPQMETIKTFFIKCLGITIQIIRNPIFSDLDHSNKIDWKEAIFLGIALSLDLFCVGIGSSLIGFTSILFPILVATFQLFFLSLGSYFGKRISSISHFPDSIWNFISGILLISIGFIKLLF